MPTHPSHRRKHRGWALDFYIKFRPTWCNDESFNFGYGS